MNIDCEHIQHTTVRIEPIGLPKSGGQGLIVLITIKYVVNVNAMRNSNMIRLTDTLYDQTDKKIDMGRNKLPYLKKISKLLEA